MKFNYFFLILIALFILPLSINAQATKLSKEVVNKRQNKKEAPAFVKEYNAFKQKVNGLEVAINNKELAKADKIYTTILKDVEREVSQAKTLIKTLKAIKEPTDVEKTHLTQAEQRLRRQTRMSKNLKKLTGEKLAAIELEERRVILRRFSNVMKRDAIARVKVKNQL